MHTGPETRTGTTIPPVPAHTVRILHTSDWQLGMKRWFLGDEAGPRYQEARLAVIERILDLAVENSCTAVVVAGDVFDDNLVDDRTWRRAVDVLRRSPVPVFLLPGNHDPYDPASIYRDPVFDSLRPTVQVLTDSASHVVATVPDDAPVLEVIGAPLLSRYMESDTVAAALREIRDRDAPSDATVPGDRADVYKSHASSATGRPGRAPRGRTRPSSTSMGRPRPAGVVPWTTSPSVTRTLRCSSARTTPSGIREAPNPPTSGRKTEEGRVAQGSYWSSMSRSIRTTPVPRPRSRYARCRWEPGTFWHCLPGSTPVRRWVSGSRGWRVCRTRGRRW
ncbi:metallophosphoesterase family protein [Corynebacterium provencense]|uniref:metallophosphoesterase family protein n=1 Tax=Corynebacterium provencense TaxID=1737425 RepID=UPI0021C2FC5E|nr:DNA repair exonuclease [Corynebacterium provencense]